MSTVAASGPASSRPARALVVPIRLYQTARSGRRSPCRYDPSCSAYAAEALQRHGAWRGLGLAARRLARCHPWGGFGPDPVPDPSAPTPTPDFASPALAPREEGDRGARQRP